MLEGFTRYNFKELGGYVSCMAPEKVPMGSATLARNVKFLASNVRVRDGLTQVWQLPEEFLPVLETACPTDQPELNIPYSTTLYVANGVAPYTWDIISGELPDGLSLDQDTGVISGTATEDGTFPYTIQVIDSSVPTRQVAHDDCVITITPVVTNQRPLSYEAWSGVDVNPARSRSLNGGLCEDNDAPVGMSTTFASCEINSTRSLALNYAQLFAFDFPEPAPPLGQVVDTVTIWARVAMNSHGATGGAPGSYILIFNNYTNNMISPGEVGILFSNGFVIDIPVANYSKTYTAAQWASIFGGTTANLWVREQQWQSLNQDFTAAITLEWYDCWIEYTYV